MDIGVVGLGLIGGSVLRTCAVAGHRVRGHDAEASTRDEARSAGFDVADDAGALRDADVLFLAVPLARLGSALDGLEGFGGLLTDVTSVKGRVAELVARRCPRVRFVGGHPMAGKESNGFAASTDALFDGCSWVLTIDESTALDDWLALAATVCGLGARVVPTTSAAHDAAVARVSHVPHLSAAALALAADDPLALSLAAGSFRDGTRVAASDPQLVAAMCSGNTAAVREALDAVIASLERARDALPSGIAEWARPASRIRRAWPPEAGEPTRIAARREDLLRWGNAGGWVTSIARDGSIMAGQPRRIMP